jgi:hypothetical protein
MLTLIERDFQSFVGTHRRSVDRNNRQHFGEYNQVPQDLLIFRAMGGLTSAR